jgi:hypothetical protein
MCSAVAEPDAASAIVTKPKRRRRQQAAINVELRREASAFACAIGKKYSDQFSADPKLKYRTTRLILALLPPRARRRGRPRDPEITRALLLYSRFHREHPKEKPCQTWHRVCAALYCEYSSLPEIEQRDVRDSLRGRVKSRTRRKRGEKFADLPTCTDNPVHGIFVSWRRGSSRLTRYRQKRLSNFCAMW